MKTSRIFLLAGVLILFSTPNTYFTELRAEVLNRNTPFIRIRIGGNGNGAVDTVIYNAGVPGHFTGVPGVTAASTTVSTNNLGGSGIYRVRIVTDTNYKGAYLQNNASSSSLTGTFSYDSSTPMQCVTVASCDSQTIDFSKISWTARDGDTLVSVLSYDDSPSQVFQTIVDTNIANNGTATRHRNFYQFEFDNDTLLPYGTYEGTVTLRAVGDY